MSSNRIKKHSPKHIQDKKNIPIWLSTGMFQVNDTHIPKDVIPNSAK
jgi:hypothetical protein